MQHYLEINKEDAALLLGAMAILSGVSAGRFIVLIAPAPDRLEAAETFAMIMADYHRIGDKDNGQHLLRLAESLGKVTAEE